MDTYRVHVPPDEGLEQPQTKTLRMGYHEREVLVGLDGCFDIECLEGSQINLLAADFLSSASGRRKYLIRFVVLSPVSS